MLEETLVKNFRYGNTENLQRVVNIFCVSFCEYFLCFV